jgi:hypothetical protein
VIAGGLALLQGHYSMLGVGSFFVGVGSLLFGMTHGFSDISSRGRLLFRIGTIAYLVGLQFFVYGLVSIAVNQ